MTRDGTHLSLYDRRIKLVVDVLREDPESATDAVTSEDAAHRLAVRVLHALDAVPGAARRAVDSAATASGRGGENSEGVGDLDAVDTQTCPVCPHPLAAHDQIGTRFCRATSTRALSRRCSCPGGRGVGAAVPGEPGGLA